jgi:Tfp pilus assembly protein PilF
VIKTTLSLATMSICLTAFLSGENTTGVPALSRCDVLVYASMSGEGEQYLRNAFRSKAIAFEVTEPFAADFKKAGASDDLVTELRKAGRSRSKPKFACNDNLYTHVAAASASTHADPSESQTLRNPQKEAEQEWRSAMALQPQNALLRVGLSMTLGRTKGWVDAAREARNAIALNPDLSAAHSQLAAALTMYAYQGGDREETLVIARKEYERAVRLDADNCYLRTNFAVTLISQRDYAAADQQLETAERRCPKLTYPMYVRANSLDGQGKRKDAIAHLRSAVEIQPNNCILWMYMVSVLKEDGDMAGATKASAQAAAQHCQ